MRIQDFARAMISQLHTNNTLFGVTITTPSKIGVQQRRVVWKPLKISLLYFFNIIFQLYHHLHLLMACPNIYEALLDALENMTLYSHGVTVLDTLESVYIYIELLSWDNVPTRVNAYLAIYSRGTVSWTRTLESMDIMADVTSGLQIKQRDLHRKRRS